MFYSGLSIDSLHSDHNHRIIRFLTRTTGTKERSYPGTWVRGEQPYDGFKQDWGELQEVQLSQRGRAMLQVVGNFAK